MRKSIAAAMSRSKREIPHYYLADEILMDTALDWLADRNAQRPITERVLPAVLQIEGRRARGAAVRRIQRLLAQMTASSPRRRSMSGWRFRCAAAVWWLRRSTTSPTRSSTS